MFHTYKVLEKKEIKEIAEDVKKLPSNKVGARLHVLAAIYGNKQVEKIRKAIFAKEV